MSAVPVPASTAQRGSMRWPTWRQAWFQLHWLVGITAGTALIVIGLTGATLMFREELLDALNPGVRHVAPRAAVVLSPQQLVDAVRAARPAGRVAQITVSSEAGTSTRVVLAPPFGVRRGETLYLDPYSGAVHPDLRGGDFFDWVESLHRWLLLPREEGRMVAGTLAICLLGMALSGLYLRWPKRALDWRHWLVFDTRLSGRSFLWGLHSVLGTWALVIYLVSTSTGIYWAFDAVRTTVDGWLQVDRQGRPAKARMAGSASTMKRGNDQAKAGSDDAASGAVDLTPAWAAFQQKAGAWRLATLRVPQRPTQPVDVNWLGIGAPHERARHRMLIRADGEITQDERYEQGTPGSRLQATIYPLHLGTYFGLPGRIAMTFGALMLPVFAVTGWMLYLKRRRAASEARRERAASLDALSTASRGRTAAGGASRWLVTYASQTGHAERLAWRTAASLTRAGHEVRVESMAALDPRTLASQGQVLLIASSFGDGEPPDSARRFARKLAAIDATTPAWRDLRFGLLALGDRHYASFCGFGRSLDAALQARGASPLFPMVEVDQGGGDSTRQAAISRWSDALSRVSGASMSIASTVERAPAMSAGDSPVWTLSRRRLWNPGSQGGPLHELTLTADRGVDWQPGALVDIVPRQPGHAVAEWLRARGLDGDTVVQHAGTSVALAGLLAASESPGDTVVESPQAKADALRPLVARRYSVASVTQDGAIELLVRQERHAEGLGIASGWLTAHAPIGGVIDLTLVDNPSFAPAAGDSPCLYIGNGSGLAGLRSHLRARVLEGRRANWLLFGERERAHDQPCRDEIAEWQRLGFLERVDLVFSRDPPRRTYVQDRLLECAVDVREWVARGVVIFVCGSLHGMSAGVDAALRDILGTDGLDDLIAAGRYRRDVY